MHCAVSDPVVTWTRHGRAEIPRKNHIVSGARQFQAIDRSFSPDPFLLTRPSVLRFAVHEPDPETIWPWPPFPDRTENRLSHRRPIPKNGGRGSHVWQPDGRVDERRPVRNEFFPRFRFSDLSRSRRVIINAFRYVVHDKRNFDDSNTG